MIMDYAQHNYLASDDGDGDGDGVVFHLTDTSWWRQSI